MTTHFFQDGGVEVCVSYTRKTEDKAAEEITGARYCQYYDRVLLLLHILLIFLLLPLLLPLLLLLLIVLLLLYGGPQ